MENRYHGSVKTLLITGTAAPPPELREVVERGSTVLRERRRLTS